MGFSQAVGSCFRNYATFTGRAPRAEYWWFALLMIILGVPASLLNPILGAVVLLPFVIPAISAEVRRLHDLDRSGWWFWIALVPLIGFVLKLIWYCSRGTEGVNRFGDDPLGNPSDIPATSMLSPASPPATSMTERAEQLAKIKALLDSGTINQEEFERMKAEVLAS